MTPIITLLLLPPPCRGSPSHSLDTIAYKLPLALLKVSAASDMTRVHQTSRQDSILFQDSNAMKNSVASVWLMEVTCGEGRQMRESLDKAGVRRWEQSADAERENAGMSAWLLNVLLLILFVFVDVF
ncbi:uncharacterized protein BJ171DRAFT_278595 [Polychytrium aggregatum]|uniref:uncharacterized protein n=1 Tax=Polychytrium aggregatum TaxID=110093 RepID=UPI0022FEBD21|nr:uncharacterized protein BJ171DRAFT_278595 [Polychytrium aggregatum]KAI9207627.1 hypothetical protein BJ171DRAFT_278595 [Polychytrium aggregatum]